MSDYEEWIGHYGPTELKAALTHYIQLQILHRDLRETPQYPNHFPENFIQQAEEARLSGLAYQGCNLTHKYPGPDERNFRGISEACLERLKQFATNTGMNIEGVRAKDHFYPRQVSADYALGIYRSENKIQLYNPHDFFSFEAFLPWRERATRVYWVTPEENKQVKKYQRKLWNREMEPKAYEEVGVHLLLASQNNDLIDLIFRLVNRVEIREQKRQLREQERAQRIITTTPGSHLLTEQGKMGSTLGRLAGSPSKAQIEAVDGKGSYAKNWLQRLVQRYGIDPNDPLGLCKAAERFRDEVSKLEYLKEPVAVSQQLQFPEVEATKQPLIPQCNDNPSETVQPNQPDESL